MKRWRLIPVSFRYDRGAAVEGSVEDAA